MSQMGRSRGQYLPILDIHISEIEDDTIRNEEDEVSSGSGHPTTSYVVVRPSKGKGMVGVWNMIFGDEGMILRSHEHHEWLNNIVGRGRNSISVNIRPAATTNLVFGKPPSPSRHYYYSHSALTPSQYRTSVHKGKDTFLATVDAGRTFSFNDFKFVDASSFICINTNRFS